MHLISPKILNEQAISKKSMLETYTFMLFCDKFMSLKVVCNPTLVP